MTNGRIPVPLKPLVAGAIKSTIHHLRLIVQEIENIGMAMNADHVSPQRAIDLVDEIAPGMLGFLSPLAGLSLPPKPDTATVDTSTSKVTSPEWPHGASDAAAA